MDRLKAYLASLHFDFVGWAKPVGLMSFIFVMISWALVIYPGPRWGIDFTGGTEVVLGFEKEIGIADLRAALSSLDIPSDAVTEVGGTEKPVFKVRIQDPEFGAHELQGEVETKLKAAFGDSWLDHVVFNAEVGARFSVFYTGDKTAPSKVAEALEGIDGVKVEEGREDRELIVKFPGLAAQVQKEISAAMGDRVFEVLSVDAVGPKVGASLRVQGAMSLIATLALILVYVGFRFDLAYAPGAVLALIHDVSVTIGIFILLGKEFNLTMIGALLTILGYSLNDTIVIYDRVRENRERYRSQDLEGLINGSINETLTRTFATAGTTMVSTLAFMFVGTEVIRDFVLAITLGVVFGTYSTIYVASPMILVTERLRPRLQALIAVASGPAVSDADDVPEQFMSDSAKRRAERERTEGVGPGEES
jgi:preprotein translocase subunit SecF